MNDELLLDFLQSNLRNKWVYYPDFKVYIRRSNRAFNTCHAFRCFDIATIEVDEHKRNQGIFSNWLQNTSLIVKEYAIESIYVESIQVPYLYNSLIKKGYQPANCGDYGCLYKVL